MMLEVKDLVKVYGKHVHALKGITMNIKPNEIFGLIGPNGSGKTTTIGIITNLITPTEGTVKIKGQTKASDSAKKAFGYVPDELLLPETLSGVEYLEFVMKMYEVDSIKRRDELLSLFDLNDASNRMIKGYSHGMKKKLQIIASLMHHPELLILDEPFRGLDPEALLIVKKIIKHIKLQGVSVLLSTHDLHLAKELCDRVGIISKGEMVEMGCTEKLLKSYNTDNLEDVFLQASQLLQRSFEHEKIINDL
ncbi:ABC transporter ATP-binding protein [Rossellomorea vietnamensis]|uniref:ABC transporter ATP-binding protein n=1 Tax=Rossellomorea vietnamensis TaxID=218284 RepID=A0A5D4K814_9BACI|nr:ABC transporter ATP-binding protein [Rossellomorea vietnamensis]TYR73474.1 ABC transporter ATP-binding protein [Rossellomorea vietnamensis]